MIIAPLQESIRVLQAISASDAGGILRRISPLPKVMFCLAFLFLTVSFGRYDWLGSVSFGVVPFVIARMGTVSVWSLFKRTLAALPFVLCAGIANCFFDRMPVSFLGESQLPGGFVSLWVLIAKTFASVGMVLVLAVTTPMNEISGALKRLHVPCILILQLQLLFRYLILVMEEARSVTNAYFLRNPANRIIPLRHWGALIGRLFLRSVERSDTIYKAMQCRLFHAGNPLPEAAKGSLLEWLGILFLILFLFCLRYWL